MKLVRDRLFIGNITDATKVIQSTDHTITHMLSLLSNQVLTQTNSRPGDPYALVAIRPGPQNVPLPTANSPSPTVVSPPGAVAGGAPGEEGEKRKGHSDAQQREKSQEDDSRGATFVRMTVSLRDMESENLLDHLTACLGFIEEGRTVGDVLVHCLAGVSRSASVITAYLMRTEKLSVDDALESLRKASSMVCPNDGFMDQLKMFEDMGFKVDHDSTIYKHFHLTNLARAGSTTSLRRQSVMNHVYNDVEGRSKETHMKKGKRLKLPDLH